MKISLQRFFQKLKCKIKLGIRQYLITEREEKLIATGMVYGETLRCFASAHDGELAVFPCPDGSCALSDVYVRYNGYTFGWIQEIIVYPERETAEVGHIATDSGLMNRGLGTRFAFALGAALKYEFGVKQIHFKERSTKIDLYVPFFEQKLRATRDSDLHGKEFWKWDIPSRLSTTLKVFT